MNGRFTWPGTVRFAKGACFCFIAPVPYETFNAIRPRIRSFDDDPTLKAACEEWRSRRSACQVRVAAGEPDAIRAGWSAMTSPGAIRLSARDRHSTAPSGFWPKPVRSAPMSRYGTSQFSSRRGA
ncbi:DUF6065 family protein [Methylorubrum extorquens]|uniref:DUF6065 family protein n=1 Tax=Methylorubrum extorquens TaxID=408 RepID=UPI000162990E|nr:DUF6065 family protein [Methylorubrum extorquens]ABY32759.1 hypothetical protein Mext_4391 [Methylorubrum extorquens PA1]KQP95545.1 hypothetical protein ASF55_00005 [Methylobacterium sp. Leaf119]